MLADFQRGFLLNLFLEGGNNYEEKKLYNKGT